VTAVSVAFVTVAVNCCVPLMMSHADVGEIETATGGGGEMLIEKFTLRTLVSLIVADCATGLKMYPLLVGVTE
jgi:hypothetical protein